MIIIGIDPGLDGALCFIYPNREPAVVDIPTVPVEGGGSVKRRVHAPALKSLIRAHCPAQEPVMVVLEDLSAGGRDSSAQTVGSQYRTRGCIEATLEILGLKPHIVHARKWKKHFGLDSDKGKALELARKLFPSLARELRFAKSHNAAEACLLARYGQQVLA